LRSSPVSRRQRNRITLALWLGTGLMAASVAPAQGLAQNRMSQTPALQIRLAPNFVPARTPESAQGEFLKGRVALLNYDLGIAAEAYKQAWLRDPTNTGLHEQAYLGALIAGDMAFLSANPVPDEVASTPAKLTARQTAIVTALQRGDKAGAQKHLTSLLALRDADRTGLLIQPWILAMNGQWDQALTTPPPALRERLVNLFLKLEQAQLLEIRGRKDEAEALYKELCAPGAPLIFFGPDYAAFMERNGRKAEAVGLYETLMKATDDPSLKLAHARASDPASTPPRLLSLEDGAAQSLYLAASVYGGEQENEYALVDLRQFLYLNARATRRADEGDKTDRAMILMGQIMQKMGDVNAAEATWDKVALTSPYYPEAQSRIGWSLKARGEYPRAEAIFETLSARDPGNVDYLMERAFLLRARDDNAGALALMQTYLKTPGARPLDWQGQYFLAVFYDLNGDWPSAETAIKASIALKPDAADALNFLGYGYVERNINLKAGLEMVRKAQSLSPKSGAIMDSVGWAYYRLKDYAEARSWLEKAFQFEPANPEIYEHMGDVYQALGRDREARFEWERIKTLAPDDKQLARIQAKIDALPVKTSPAKAPAVGTQASR
jgi:tetratricopeptide (TPR) repeat protein